MSSRKLTLLSVVLCCASWAVAQSGARRGRRLRLVRAARDRAPPRHSAPEPATPPAGPATPPARTATPPAGTATPQTAPGQNPHFPWLHFAQWNSEHRRTRVDLAQLHYRRKHHTAFNGQSQHNQFTPAPRPAVRPVGPCPARQTERQVPPRTRRAPIRRLLEARAIPALRPGMTPSPGTPCPPAASSSPTSPQA